jgi:hypothetical protein
VTNIELNDFNRSENELGPAGYSEVNFVIKAVLLLHAGAKDEKRYCSYSLLTPTIGGVSGQRHAVLRSRERTSGTHWIGALMGLRAGLDTKAGGNVLWTNILH